MEHLTLVIPAKNEKESLPSVLEELKRFNLKILVILEKNDLETINSINNYDCEILYQEDKGYGDALIHGINKTKTKYFCIFNADGSFVPDELQHMYNLLEDGNGDFVMTAFPNPTSDVLYVEVSNAYVDTEFTLSDVNGRLVEVLNVNSVRTSIDVSNLEPGVYVLRSAKLNRSLQVVVQ